MAEVTIRRQLQREEPKLFVWRACCRGVSQQLQFVVFHNLPRCCSDALHHSHWLPKDVCPLLPVPAQVQNRVPPQLHNDHAICWTHEVGSLCLQTARLLTNNYV